MKEFKSIARKRILFNKTESVFVVVAIAVVVGVLFFSFSLSINYFDFFLNEAGNLTGNSLQKVFENGFSNLSEIGEYLIEFTMYFVSYEVPEKIEDIIPPPVADNSDSLFSAHALVENLPLTLFIMIIIVVVISWVSISIVFSACKRERSKFFSVLLLSGASDKQIKKCAFYEGVYYCLVAVPLGSVLGIIGVYTAEFIIDLLFEKLNLHSGGLIFPVELRFSPSSLLVVLPFIFLLVCHFSKKACKKLSVKTTATRIRQVAGTDIGLCTFTANPLAYKRKGMEYYVAIRNFQNNFGKYFKIIFMTVTYTGIIGLTFVIFNVIRNYNNQEIYLYSNELLSFTFAFQLFFCCIAIALCIVSVCGTFMAVSANINSNMGEYAVMHSAGSSVKAVLKTVRMEGFICGVSGLVFSFMCVIYSVAFMMQIYGNDSEMRFSGFGTVAGAVCMALTLFLLCVFITVLMVNKKMKNLDTVKVLKDYFY